MSEQEQQELCGKYYAEAMRYMSNAREYLKSAQIEDDTYQDKKYVRTACGTAYSGVLIAMDGFFIMKGLHKPTKKERKSIEYYQKNLANQDKKMLTYLNIVYQILHLYGYYDGINDAIVIKRGFDLADDLIEKIKPM